MAFLHQENCDISNPLTSQWNILVWLHMGNY